MTNLGGIEILEHKGTVELPQRAASAFGAVEELVGAKYKPIAYVGNQIVKGTNHYFIAQQTLTLAKLVRHIVLITVNEFEGKYSLVNIETII